MASGPARTQARPLQEAADLRSLAERVFVQSEFIASGYPAGEAAVERHSLRDRFLGLAVIVAVGGGFWTGIGLLIARLVR